MRECHVKIGQLVVLKTGHVTQIVRDIECRQGRYLIRTQYPSTIGFHSLANGEYIEKCWEVWRDACDYQLKHPQYNNKELMVMDEVYIDNNNNNNRTTLYQTKESTPRFGTKIATNSQGKPVLEMKGSGEVEVFEKDAIEEVVPYTAEFKMLSERKDHQRNVHFQIIAGSVEVGDIVIDPCSGGMFAVFKLDTKQRNAPIPHGKFVKLLTEEVAL